MFDVPKAYPMELHRDVDAVARKTDAPIAKIAKDFGISESCLQRRLALADIADGARPGRLTPIEFETTNHTATAT
jgi:hypothetical protein